MRGGGGAGRVGAGEDFLLLRIITTETTTATAATTRTAPTAIHSKLLDEPPVEGVVDITLTELVPSSTTYISPVPLSYAIPVVVSPVAKYVVTVLVASEIRLTPSP